MRAIPALREAHFVMTDKFQGSQMYDFAAQQLDFLWWP